MLIAGALRRPGRADARRPATGILELCRQHGMRVVEDAAHAFPARCDGRMIGSFGDVTCFSFYANKTITTGEGGMLTTDDEAIARRAKVMRLHGIDRDVWNRFTADKPSWEYDVVAPGFKYNMPDITAAIGLAQLERAERPSGSAQRCAVSTCERLAGPRLSRPAPCRTCAMEDHAWHLFPIVLNENAPVSRNRFIELLAERGHRHLGPLQAAAPHDLLPGRYGSEAGGLSRSRKDLAGLRQPAHLSLAHRRRARLHPVGGGGGVGGVGSGGSRE